MALVNSSCHTFGKPLKWKELLRTSLQNAFTHKNCKNCKWNTKALSCTTLNEQRYRWLHRSPAKSIHSADLKLHALTTCIKQRLKCTSTGMPKQPVTHFCSFARQFESKASATIDSSCQASNTGLTSPFQLLVFHINKFFFPLSTLRFTAEQTDEYSPSPQQLAWHQHLAHSRPHCA